MMILMAKVNKQIERLYLIDIPIVGLSKLMDRLDDFNKHMLNLIMLSKECSNDVPLNNKIAVVFKDIYQILDNIDKVNVESISTKVVVLSDKLKELDKIVSANINN